MTPGLVGLPAAQLPVVEAEARELHRKRTNDQTGSIAPILLLRAAPTWTGPDHLRVAAVDGQPEVDVRVRSAGSVLGILEAIDDRPEAALLIVLTDCPDDELGESLLARVAGQKIHQIDHWELIRGATRAGRIDPSLRTPDLHWLAEALLDAGSTTWSAGSGRIPMLRRSTLLNRLTAQRLGFDADRDIDLDTLLRWSDQRPQVASFAALPEEQRRGLIDHLVSTIGPAAELSTRLALGGYVGKVPAVGLVLNELHSEPAEETTARKNLRNTAKIRVEERFLGRWVPRPEAVLAFVTACRSHIQRLADSGEPDREEQVYLEAGEMLASLQAADLASDSGDLAIGFTTRLTEFASAVTTALMKPNPTTLTRLENSATRVHSHRLGLSGGPVLDAVSCAVRLVRWLASPQPALGAVADFVGWQIRQGGWVDRAIAILHSPETAGVDRLARSYEKLFTVARERRADLDKRFANRLAAWSGTETSTLLLAENLMDRIALPLAERAAPLLIVVDGMSSADATAIAEGIAETGTYLEVGRHGDGREGVLATIPSATRFSRTSLLAGKLTTGGQRDEDTGFAKFWGRRKTAMFHKDELRSVPGSMLPDGLRFALAEANTVVGVVLNSIDDALSKDQRIAKPVWDIGSIDYLVPLLAEAALTERPVVLTSDHGHIRDYGSSPSPIKSEASRFRHGAPQDGEVKVSGPRVLTDSGEVVVPYDETIRYVSRKAGYHGGVSLSEMVIPLLIYVPIGRARAAGDDKSHKPPGWESFPKPEYLEPQWWNNPVSDTAPASITPVKTDRPLPDAEPLFTTDSLGARVCGTELFTRQATFVRKRPDQDAIVALIDALDRAGGKLPVAAAADAMGQPVARIRGALAQVKRVLNVEGYRVITTADAERTVELNVRLLKEQFLGR